MLVSICIPVYNMEDCLERSIRSALNQDYPDLEVIVVDNQSSDATYKIATSIVDTRLKVFRNETNLGAYGNHNRCIELAGGEWIKFLHGDDELLPNCISKMVEALKRCPEDTALVGCGAINYGYQNKEIARSFIPEDLYVMRAAYLREFVLEGNFFGTPSMSFIHRERLISLGGFDRSMEPASDGDCWIKLRRSFACAYLPAHLVIIRDDPPGNRGQRIKQAARFCDQIFRQIDKWHKLDAQLSEVPIKETFYSDWLCYETFRYWDSALRYVLFLNFALLLMLIKGLYSRDMIFNSWWFYFSNRLRGRKSTTFREQPWTTVLRGIRT